MRILHSQRHSGVYPLGSCLQQANTIKMKMHKTLAFAAISVLLSVCSGHIGGRPFPLQDIEPQFYCGRVLSKTLGLLCYGLPLNDKRALGSSKFNAILSQYYNDQESEANWPWIPSHQAKSMSASSRDKRYVVNECCDKPCSITELMYYC